MTRIKVKYLGNFRYVTGQEEETIEINGNTIQDVLDELKTRHGEAFLEEIMDLKTGKLLSSFVFLLNGSNVFSLGGLEAKVKRDDRITFVAMVGGG
jgi:MoaD family protein